ncbi:HlyD family secretion protein [Ferrimonas marina]|uniref:RND family efflux transporter, MFP subunit n=1 Tax=Ferrimonas marina TaxID=299255 RepID=A0A1M5R4J1_9GAMM|nr:HlyD family secretion protein [Ferrimonas marina]SHH21315.1 RND family efflux transporter, MFP subunit [Ferrimonas marina]
MIRFLVTGCIIALAVALVGQRYHHHLDNPWTRDGLVRAHIIQVTPRVTGPLKRVHIEDNSQVAEGQLLFEVDPVPYETALAKAEAGLLQAKAALEKAVNENNRSKRLEQREPNSISTLQLNNYQNAVDVAEANVKAAEAGVREAQLNLEYTKIYAAADGFITNLNLHEGTQVVANQPMVALIDQNSFWVDGFFKETDLNGVAVGDRAEVTLMGYSDHTLTGEVTSIGYGIAQSDGSTGAFLLPNVNPNFQWIRLAQRVPVKVTLDSLPQEIQLRVGTTASVQLSKSVPGGV